MIEWSISDGLTDYARTAAFMEERAARIAAGEAPELVWMLEHPPLYTRGASSKSGDLRDPKRFPVFDSARGGQFTYHGPGQRVAYVMLDLTRRGRDVRAFVCSLEQWVIDTLAAFNVRGERRPGRVGVWVDRVRPEEKASGVVREDKIAAIGVRVKRWVTFHGVSLNVEPDLDHFSGITPCGIDDPRYGVTSLAALGRLITMHDVDIALKSAFEPLFGDVAPTPAPRF